jgi:predicted O-methyltransferase YrrM
VLRSELLNKSSPRFPKFWRAADASGVNNSKTDCPVCEISSYQDYASGYSRLADLLGRPENEAAASDVESLHNLLTRRNNATGSLGLSDCLFLAAFVRIVSPKRIIEIGTGSGFSAALLALAIRSQSSGQNGVCVDTIDVNAEYFGNENLNVGFEIQHLLPDLSDAVRVHAPRQSDFIGNLAKPDELELVFIDADHQHPRPLLDVLRVAPFVRGCGWILLHDTRLGSMGCGSEKAGCSYAACFGAEWLFEAWPFRKISGGNVGAIQLPREKRQLLPTAKKLLKLPFEVRDQRNRHLRSEVRKCFTQLR